MALAAVATTATEEQRNQLTTETKSEYIYKSVQSDQNGFHFKTNNILISNSNGLAPDKVRIELIIKEIANKCFTLHRMGNDCVCVCKPHSCIVAKDYTHAILCGGNFARNG